MNLHRQVDDDVGFRHVLLHVWHLSVWRLQITAVITGYWWFSVYAQHCCMHTVVFSWCNGFLTCCCVAVITCTIMVYMACCWTAAAAAYVKCNLRLLLELNAHDSALEATS
jgi:hypothetical protein